MTKDEAIKYGKEQLEIFGGKHADFIKLAIELLEQDDNKKLLEIKQIKETVPREVYEHEYTLRKNLETEILHLERIINNLWIPVDEQLPKRETQSLSEDVQVTIKDEFGFTVDVAYYDFEEKKWHSEMLDDCDKVLAWKPLPQPYRNDLCDTKPFDNNKFGG